MDQPSLHQNSSATKPPGPPPKAAPDAAKGARLPLQIRVTEDTAGSSPAERAAQDLDITLQLLTERARYITGASGAAIALREGDSLTCRASAGTCAPGIGTALEIRSGLSGESVRTRQLLRCDDASNDPRVNRAVCESLGIASAIVMPLLRQEQVIGVFELLSGEAHAFEERDITALQRLGEMIQTAVEHAEAAGRAAAEIAQDRFPSLAQSAPPAPQASPVTPQSATQKASAPKDSTAALAAEAGNLQNLLAEHGKVTRCESCGFPISGGRRLCLDCETSRAPREPAPRQGQDPALVIRSPLDAGEEGESWLQSHKYLVGTLLVAAATVLVVVCLR